MNDDLRRIREAEEREKVVRRVKAHEAKKEAEYKVATEGYKKVENNKLVPGELHPSAKHAMDYILSFDAADLMGRYFDAFKVMEKTDNYRVGQVCLDTLRRLVKGEQVSDTEALGLAWALREVEEGVW